jgi:DNA-binding MarR family transcriptional regulator
MTTKPPNDSSNQNGLPKRGRARSAAAGGAARSPAVRDGADRKLGAELEQLVTTLPRQVSHLSRVLYRTRGSTLPRGMRSVVFTLAFEPLRISDIAWQEGIGQPAATRMVARLEALGLVSRERSTPDGRIVMVALTEQGRAELDTLREQSRRLLREALRDRSPSEVRRMRAASEALELISDWILEQERIVDGAARLAQSTTAPASRRKTRRALSS